LPLRVLICNEAPLVRDGLHTMLDDEQDVSVVGTADSGVHAMILARSRHLDVVLTGLNLNGMSGAELIRRLEKEPLAHTPRVVVFSVNDDEDLLVDALHAGAAGLLTKDSTKAELLAALHAVAQGHAMLAPQITQRLLHWFRGHETDPDGTLRPALETVTPREREVLRLVGQGLLPEEIARNLSLGVATIRTHIYRLRTKLGLKDRAQLVSFAFRAGLMRPTSTDWSNGDFAQSPRLPRATGIVTG
jgi:DNA-binding NarL/FixJ family response regulator